MLLEGTFRQVVVLIRNLFTSSYLTDSSAGLGTLAKKMVSQPVKTVKAGMEFVKSYNKMKKANVIGGNLPAHEEANRKATEVSDAETAAAFSALREQSKRHRKGGDKRTKEETAATMDANKRGRENAKNG